MRDNTFTPGPWEYDDYCRVTTADEEVRFVAETHERANARLIAAAPDLYNALWEAVELSDRTLPEYSRTAECQRVYDLCVAALKKAEGDA